jgi:hypothetical protein
MDGEARDQLERPAGRPAAARCSVAKLAPFEYLPHREWSSRSAQAGLAGLADDPRTGVGGHPVPGPAHPPSAGGVWIMTRTANPAGSH